MRCSRRPTYVCRDLSPQPRGTSAWTARRCVNGTRAWCIVQSGDIRLPVVDADRPGHDLNYQAEAGILAPTRRAPTLLIADITAGMRAAFLILAALLDRTRTTRGAVSDLSVHEAALAWVPFFAPPKLRGDYACYNVYQTSDRHHVALGALESKFWERFCRSVRP